MNKKTYLQPSVLTFSLLATHHLAAGSMEQLNNRYSGSRQLEKDESSSPWDNDE